MYHFNQWIPAESKQCFRSLKLCVIRPVCSRWRRHQILRKFSFFVLQFIFLSSFSNLTEKIDNGHKFSDIDIAFDFLRTHVELVAISKVYHENQICFWDTLLFWVEVFQTLIRGKPTQNQEYYREFLSHLFQYPSVDLHKKSLTFLRLNATNLICHWNHLMRNQEIFQKFLELSQAHFRSHRQLIIVFYRSRWGLSNSTQSCSCFGFNFLSLPCFCLTSHNATFIFSGSLFSGCLTSHLRNTAAILWFHKLNSAEIL